MTPKGTAEARTPKMLEWPAESLRLRLPLVWSALAAFAVPVMFDAVSGTPRAFIVPKLTALHVLAALGAAMLLSDGTAVDSLKREGFPRSLLWLAGLWLALMGLTTVLAEWPGRSWAGSYDWQMGVFTQLSLVSIAIIIFWVARGLRESRILLRVVIWSSAPIVAYGLIQNMGVDPAPWSQWGDAGSAFSTLGNENYFGAYLALLMPLTLAGWFVFDGLPERLGLSALIAAQAVCLVGTHSVGGAIAAASSCALVVWWRWRFHPWPARAALAGALALSMAATLAVAMRGDAVGEAIVSVTGREVRPFTWATAYRAAISRPLIGWGLSSFDLTHEEYASPGFRRYVMPMERVMDRTHNLWLEMAVETGLAGVALWWVVAASIGSAALGAAGRMEPPSRWMVLSGVAASFGYLVYQMVNPADIGTASVFWWVIGWTLGVCFPKGSEGTPLLQPDNARFLLQVILLVGVFGAGYGLWLWFVARL